MDTKGRKKVLLLEPFNGSSMRGVWTKDLNYLSLVTRFSSQVLRFTGPMRLGSLAVPPLGLAQLAASLKLAGYSVFHVPMIHQALKRELSDAYLQQRLAERSFDAVCISIGDPLSAKEGLRVAHICKQINSKAPVIVGGSQPTLHPQYWTNRDNVDYIVRGQGDRAAVTLLNHLLAGSQPPHLSGVFSGNHIAEETTEKIPFCELPPMDFEAVEVETYMTKSQMVYLQASQGCPHECPFCLHHKLWGKKLQLRPVENIEAELKVLQQSGCKLVYFIDSAFTLNRDHALDIAEMIIKNKFKMTFCCETRADGLDRELLERMKQARFAVIWLGGESGSPNILKNISGKSHAEGLKHLENLRTATKLAKDAGILIGASWIIGLPGESWKTVAETTAFLEELVMLGMDMMDIRSLLLLPGTDYYANPEKFGLKVLDREWENKEFRAKNVAAATEFMTTQEIADAQVRLNAKLAQLFQAKGLAFVKHALHAGSAFGAGYLALLKNFSKRLHKLVG